MFRTFFIVFFACFALSCQNKKQSNDSRLSSSFEKEREVFYANLRTPDEVALLLHQTNIGFDSSRLNDTQKAVHYTSNEVKAAANLGIYLADLNYSMAYQQHAMVARQFEAASELSHAIGMERGVLDFLTKRYEENFSQNDSMKMIIDSLFNKATNGLKGTVNENLIGIAMAAYEIENLHIVLGLLENSQKGNLTPDDSTQHVKPLHALVLSQRQRIEIIYSFLKSVADPLDPNRNPNFPYYANAFEELIKVFRKIEPKLEGPSQGLVGEVAVKELSEKVNAIRTKIISNQ